MGKTVPATALASFVICASSVMKQVIEIMGCWLFLQKEKSFQHDIYVEWDVYQQRAFLSKAANDSMR